MFERMIAGHAATDGRAIAVRLGLSLAISYQTMDEDIRRCAAWLGKRGIPAGTRVVLQLDDPYLHWVFAFACEALGLIFIPEGSRSPLDADRLAFFGARHVVSSASALGPDSASIDGVAWITIDRLWQTRMRALRPQPLPKRARRGDDPICILLSSGTTGTAKKVLFTRALIDRRLDHIARAFSGDRTKGQLLLIPVQTFTGFTASFAAFCSGRAIGYRMPGDSYAALVGTGWFDSLVAAPILAEQVMADLPADAEPLDNFRITVGGGALSEALAADIRARLTPNIRIGYGTTESGVVTNAPRIDENAREGFAGTILPWVEVSIVDPVGELVAVGQTGEVRLRGDALIDGYCDDADQTARYFRDGWYHPGDIGHVDDAGGLTIEGRIDDLLNIAGRKILPTEVERILRDTPGVIELTAFAASPPGAATTRLGIAYVADTDLDPALFANRVPEFPDPVAIRIAEIPRNLMGKVERHRLRDASG